MLEYPSIRHYHKEGEMAEQEVKVIQYRFRVQQPYIFDGDIAFDIFWKDFEAVNDDDALDAVEEYIKKQKVVTLGEVTVRVKPLELVRVIKKW